MNPHQPPRPRRHLPCFLATLLHLLILPVVVQAQFDYTTNNGTITITGYAGPGGAVAIPDTISGLPVTSIGNSAFYYKSSLTSVTIPNSFTSIGYDAFAACHSLTDVTIPNSVTSIGVAAFASCTSLTSVTIPDSVTSIGVGAFSVCTSLTAITVDALNADYRSVDGVLFNKSQTVLIIFPGGKAGRYTIPSSVTNISSFAFSYCTSLTNVTIPNSVTSIGNSAFVSCASLISVTIPNNVTNIGVGTFSGCSALASATIPDSVTSIEGGAFQSCISLTSVTIPNSVTSIGEVAFSGCTSLASVTIPNSVTSIVVGAFSYCTSLSAITVDALNSFYSSVDGVLFNKSQTVLIIFPGGKAGSYTIPNGVTSTVDYAFSGCTSLTSVTIPNSVTSIGNSAFVSCTSLTSVTIPNSVTSIGSSAFFYCTSLTSVTIPDSVTSIPFRAFASCTSLTGVYFQGNAPGVSFFVFDNANNATVYYLPGTTGWRTTFAGRPAVLWNPLVDTSHASFGGRTNRFGFTITGASNLVIVVEAATNLAYPAWIPVGTNTLTGGSYYGFSYFSDPQWTNYPARFYRLRSP